MEAFKSHFERFCRLLRKRGRHSDQAEDLVQEAYVRLLSYIDRGEKVLETEAFLARTVMNLDVDQARRERAHAFEPRPIEELLLIDPSSGPEEDFASEQYVLRTGRILDESVGKKTRAAFFMHCLEGMTYEEVGAQLHLSGRSVERHIAKAVALLSLSKRPQP